MEYARSYTDRKRNGTDTVACAVERESGMKRGKRNNLFLRAGNWCVDIIIDGQRTRRSFGKDKRAAEAVLLELEKQRTLARLSSSDVIETIKPKQKTESITFAEMCEKFLELRRDRKLVTLRGYAGVVNRALLPEFGKLKLTQITPELIMRFRMKLQSQKSKRRTRAVKSNGQDDYKYERLKSGTINTVLGVLRNILDEAARLGDIDNSPFRRVRGTASSTRENKPLSLGQVHKIIEKCDESFRPLITFLAYTGCRPSEAFALKWDDVDFERGEISISAARVIGVESTPKTKAGNRTIVMLPPVRAVLKSLKEQQAILELGRHVFLTAAGQPINEYSALYRAWSKALKAAGLPRRRPYELRHSFASNMLAEGMPIPFISRMIGHANPATTFAYYAADVESLREQYAKRMADLIADSAKPTKSRRKTSR